jgi:hypothetical protein
MTKQVLTFLLIFTMVIAPIASAFEHCAGMDMSEFSSDSQSWTVVMSADDLAPSNHENMLNGRLDSQGDVACHASSCIFHVCGGCAIISAAATIHLAGSADYSNSEYISSYNTVLPLDIKPPISIL